MKYTFLHNDKTKTVNIPDDYIQKTKQNLNITTKEAIELWLFDNDYITNEEADALTAKAKENPVNHQAERKPRKAPERKPNEKKRELIAGLRDYLDTVNGLENVETTNIERMIAFECGGEKYEITLTQKRKPKNS